jgi:hypothetical protein
MSISKFNRLKLQLNNTMRTLIIKKATSCLTHRQLSISVICELQVRTLHQTINGPPGSYAFLAPICSIRRLQFDPRK